MAIKIAISDLVKFKVAGSFNDEHGNPEPFDFTLTCKRFATIAEFEAYQAGKSQTDFLVGLARAWSGVKDPATGAEVEFSEEALRQLLALPGMPHVTYLAYLTEAGAKTKN